MGEVIAFPRKVDRHASAENAAFIDDPYFRFIQSVLQTADACGFRMPFTIDSAAKLVYDKTRDTSELAKLLNAKR
ncbi:MAG: hypothetical protein GC149_19045 [Gammaproteobacteria bacterium]|nr:hypothetical protein [Gammaproteobacteria bacterium]